MPDAPTNLHQLLQDTETRRANVRHDPIATADRHRGPCPYRAWSCSGIMLRMPQSASPKNPWSEVDEVTDLREPVRAHRDTIHGRGRFVHKNVELQ